MQQSQQLHTCMYVVYPEHKNLIKFCIREGHLTEFTNERIKVKFGQVVTKRFSEVWWFISGYQTADGTFHLNKYTTLNGLSKLWLVDNFTYFLIWLALHDTSYNVLEISTRNDLWLQFGHVSSVQNLHILKHIIYKRCNQCMTRLDTNLMCFV